MSKQFKRFKDAAKDFIFGMTTYDYTVELKHKMFQHECILEAVIFGDRYGFPTSNYYRLRLLPYWLKRLNQIDKEILREKDVLEKL
ncbi:MAG: hypothetical protein ACPLZF_02295 [Nitrososphaeria archaeon]